MFRFLTKNYTKVPLFRVLFNLKRFNANGAENSCTVSMHPVLANDDFINLKLKEVINHIRDNYDMERLIK